MSAFLTLDGSHGEGGGQILRSSLALSLVTGTPFHITRIRAGRPRPGLRRQHLAAVRAASAVGGAEVEGAALGSEELRFIPHRLEAGSYRFAVGSAGSATLVLQAVLPALLLASGPSHLVLEGGTHNPWAPPFEFLDKAFFPLLRRLGATVEATLEVPGFYPAGGGRFLVAIAPRPPLHGFDLSRRSRLRGLRAEALLSRLPRRIGEREIASLLRLLPLDPGACSVRQALGSPGPGNALLVEIESEEVTEVVSGIGRRGVPAEAVAEAVAREAQAYLDAGVPVGSHLADQLLLPLALAGGGSFVTHPLSSHATTNLEVLRWFLDLSVRVEPLDGQRVRLELGRERAPATGQR